MVKRCTCGCEENYVETKVTVPLVKDTKNLKQTEIIRMIELIRERINSLDKSTIELLDRLSPVLSRSGRPTPENEKNVLEAPTSELGETLYGISCMIKSINNRIEETNDLLEV